VPLLGKRVAEVRTDESCSACDQILQVDSLGYLVVGSGHGVSWQAAVLGPEQPLLLRHPTRGPGILQTPTAGLGLMGLRSSAREAGERAADQERHELQGSHERQRELAPARDAGVPADPPAHRRGVSE
jgi:hypothetical protein